MQTLTSVDVNRIGMFRGPFMKTLLFMTQCLMAKKVLFSGVHESLAGIRKRFLGCFSTC